MSTVNAARPAARPVCVVPLAPDGAVTTPWKPVGTARSRTGAIRAARAAGYRVVTRGGLIECAYCPRCDGTGWTVTVAA